MSVEHHTSSQTHLVMSSHSLTWHPTIEEEKKRISRYEGDEVTLEEAYL